MTTRSLPPRRRQQGAALLTAMVIVTLMATLTVGMIWQQWRAVQVEAAERTQVQARWVLDGALDWARLILREDARAGGPDHLGEPWAVELKEARLSTFLAADKDNTDDAPEAFLSGTIRDAQARFNLNSLIRDNKFQPKEVASLSKLCELVGSSPIVAQRLADAMRQAHPSNAADTGEQGATAATATAAGTNAPLMPIRISQLTWLGLDETTVARLEPYLVILPRATAININTAPKEVIAAVTGVDLATAQRLVQTRTRTPFKTIDDARTALGLEKLDGARVAVGSSFFEVEGSLRIDRLVVAQRSLVERSGLDVKLRRSERVLPGSNPAIRLQQ